MKDNSIAFYQHSTCLPSPNSSLIGQDVNSYSTLMDTATPGRRTRIQPSSLPGGAPSTVYLYTYEVSLAFVPVADVEVVFYEITYYIQTNYPKLMCTVNYFEKTYLGSVIVDSEVRLLPAACISLEPRTWLRAFTEDLNPECIAQSPLFKSMCELLKSSR